METEITDAVIVTYEPERNILKNLINSLVNQVRNLYIVDNTKYKSDIFNEYVNYLNVEVTKLEANYGIAFAQNVGIKKSLANGSSYILISDQDTVYPDHYVKNMIRALENFNSKAAAIAPLYKDLNRAQQNMGFIKSGRFILKKFFPTEGLHEIAQAIASGLIIDSKKLKEIGLMDEKLFIDWVDLEWCWRAKSLGYKIIGNADVIIKHHLGDYATGIGFIKVPIRKPERSYYITRNAIYLALKYSRIGSIKRLIMLIKAFRLILVTPILAKPRLAHLKYFLWGLRDGISGRLGKLEKTD